MAKANKMPAIGAWAYLAGLVISVLAAFVYNPWIPLVLGILGLVVGLLNISESEVQHFLIAGIAFLLSVTSLALIVAQFGTKLGFDVSSVAGIFGNLAVFIAPAVAVVALKAVYDISKD